MALLQSMASYRCTSVTQLVSQNHFRGCSKSSVESSRFLAKATINTPWRKKKTARHKILAKHVNKLCVKNITSRLFGRHLMRVQKVVKMQCLSDALWTQDYEICDFDTQVKLVSVPIYNNSDQNASSDNVWHKVWPTVNTILKFGRNSAKLVQAINHKLHHHNTLQ